MKQHIKKIGIQRQRGMTLIELMVASGLSLLLMLGVGTIFQANRVTYNLQKGLSDVQENARVALAVMASDIRGAGYVGCSSTDTELIHNLLDGSAGTAEEMYFWDFGNMVSGSEAIPNGALNPALPGMAINGVVRPNNDVHAVSDVLTLRIIEQGNAHITAHASTQTQMSNQMIVSEMNGLEEGNVVVASNCERSLVFQITNDPSGGTVEFDTSTSRPGNMSTANVQAVSLINGDIGVLKTRTYFIRQGASGEPALWRIENSNTGWPVAQELVEGIESLQVSYGIDHDGALTRGAGSGNSEHVIDQYYTADQISSTNSQVNWTNVVTVRISLIARSKFDNVLDNASNLALNTDDTPNFNAVETFPKDANTDNRLRQTFNMTVALRNMTK